MKIGVVCRFKPLHLVHAALLEALCREGDEVLIGIGSSNRYDRRNPFTANETADMIHAALGDRTEGYRLIEVPDLGHGPRWRERVQGLMGELDLFVSANDYVRGLMGEVYPLAHPLDLLSEEDRAPIDGTRVRRAMARGNDWEALVPRAVRDYLVANDLPERFRREFGLATLIEELGPALLTPRSQQKSTSPLAGPRRRELRSSELTMPALLDTPPALPATPMPHREAEAISCRLLTTKPEVKHVRMG